MRKLPQSTHVSLLLSRLALSNQRNYFRSNTLVHDNVEIIELDLDPDAYFKDLVLSDREIHLKDFINLY